MQGHGGHHRYQMASVRGRFRPFTHNVRAGQSNQRPSGFDETVDTSIKLISNAYLLSMNQKSSISEYSLSICASQGFKDVPDHVFFRVQVNQAIRSKLIFEIIPLLTNSNTNDGSVVIDLNLHTIYSSMPFKKTDKTDKNADSFQFKNILVEEPNQNIRLRIDVSIDLTRSFTTSNKELVTPFLGSILHNQLLLERLRFGASYYKCTVSEDSALNQSDRLDLISKHLMGISISGVRRCADDQNIVIVNCPNIYITGSHRLIDLLASYIYGKAIQGINLIHSQDRANEIRQIPELSVISGNEDWFTEFCDMLTGFKCRSTWSQYNATFRLTMIGESASKVIINSASGQCSVFHQFKELGINLNYPNLPCFKSNSDEIPYYPLELCSLLPNQKVPVFRLGTAARNHLSKINRPDPQSFVRLASEARNDLEKACSRELAKFGAVLSTQPEEATSSCLSRPTLKYNRGNIKPQQDYWESGIFFEPKGLLNNWCVVDTAFVDPRNVDEFISGFSQFSYKFGFKIDHPGRVIRGKKDISEYESMKALIEHCKSIVGRLRFIMFIIDSNSTQLNRLIHLIFDEHPNLSAACIRVESVMKTRQHRSIFRTLVHKFNTRLGGTNCIYDSSCLEAIGLKAKDLMIVGLDVTHPDNELKGASIVGCAYTYGEDLFKHKTLAWPQGPRVEIIGRLSELTSRLLSDYQNNNGGLLPKHLIVYRDGVSHEDFDKVNLHEVSCAAEVANSISQDCGQERPELSYIIAQKRHMMRFFHVVSENNFRNPPSGTLIDKKIVKTNRSEFYLFSNTSHQQTARPLHYHVLSSGLDIDTLQRLTYYLCFNFGRCSSSLSMPSCLRYAHNSAYEARNRVITGLEFNCNKFYTSKFFC